VKSGRMGKVTPELLVTEINAVAKQRVLTQESLSDLRTFTNPRKREATIKKLDELSHRRTELENRLLGFPGIFQQVKFWMVDICGVGENRGDPKILEGLETQTQVHQVFAESSGAPLTYHATTQPLQGD